VEAAGTAANWESCLVRELTPGAGPALTHLDGMAFTYGNRLTPELTSRLELRPGYRLLDLGCGDENNLGRVPLAPGVEHVGVDYEGEGPDYLADAHALPFPDDSFDGVLSLAVLEHVRNPHLVTQEVARVLAPGGVFAGTVAFLEPFHLQSLYHHSAYGTWAVLHEAGFVDIEIQPNRDWDVVRANVEMGLVPGGPWVVRRWIGKVSSAFFHLLWRFAPRGASLERYANFTGGFRFVARLPA
jgi:SAM-dependent methyltransferase